MPNDHSITYWPERVGVIIITYERVVEDANFLSATVIEIRNRPPFHELHILKHSRLRRSRLPPHRVWFNDLYDFPKRIYSHVRCWSSRPSAPQSSTRPPRPFVLFPVPSSYSFRSPQTVCSRSTLYTAEYPHSPSLSPGHVARTYDISFWRPPPHTGPTRVGRR